MLPRRRRLPARAWWLLWLLPSVLSAHASGEGRPKPRPCQQSPTRVSCRGAGLHAVPKELAHGVERLELSNNFIRSLPESRAPWSGRLEHLDLSSNRLEAVSEAALARLPRLRSLLLGSNHLDRNYVANGRALRQLRNVEVLDLSANNLESHMASWYVSNLTALRRLDLSGNRMTRLPAGIFRSAPRLRELDLSNNFIMDIEEGAFEALRELRVLDLALNSLHCLSGFALAQLRVLNLSHNALELFVAEEQQGQRYLLRVLDLSHNRLLLFPALPHARCLTHLNLSGNAIASLVPRSRPAEFLLPYAEVARHSNRSVSSVADLTRVADLDLSNNQLHQLPFAFFHRLTSLHSLDVSMNCLQDVTRGDAESDTSLGPREPVFLSVRSLDLHGNVIHSLPRWFFDSLPHLESIDLGSNSLQPCESQETSEGEVSGGDSPAPAPGGTCTAFHNILGLKHLSLRKNNLARLYPYMFNQTPLVSLDLSENEGLFMPKEALAGLEFSLQKLSLRGNQMRDGQAGFPCLRALNALDLSSNSLSRVPTGLLCSPLERLDVRSNELAALAEAALAGWSRSLRLVSLAGNPFSCCALAWLDALRAAGAAVRDLGAARCSYRERGRNLSVRITGSPRWLCPRAAGGSALPVLAVGIGLLFAACGACCLLERARTGRGCSRGRSNRVEAEPAPPEGEKAATAGPGDSVTKV